VLVLGADGMLGHRVEHSLRKAGIEAVTTSRLGDAVNNRTQFNAITDSVADLLSKFAARTSLIVNAIGVIKPQIDEQSELSRLNALEVNAVFPHKLALAASRVGIRVVQIATDCVFSGDKGSYVETSPHDAADLYGQSKSMGEVISPVVMHLRCSIVGTERSTKRSLWEWVRNQPDGATVRGFRNHLWNGITTDAFGRLCVAILKQDLHCAGVHHIVPSDQVSKAQLVEAIAHKSGRKDIKIEVEDVYPPVNRTLASTNSQFNEKLWAAAGFDRTPSIEDLITQFEL
jgi:dTDP-4-dehydrorhamnose reductase